MIYKIVRLFLNTLTSNGEHYLLNGGNLTEPIQMQLSQNKKSFSQLSFAFLKPILNFSHFAKRADSHS